MDMKTFRARRARNRAVLLVTNLIASTTIPCAILVWVTRGFAWVLPVGVVLGWILVLLAALPLVVWLAVRKFRDGSVQWHKRPWLAYVITTLAAAFVGIASSLPIARGVETHDVQVVKSWVARLVPRIDEYQRTTGGLPVNVEVFCADEELPYLWRKGVVFYQHDEAGYSFDIALTLYGGEFWGTAERRWILYD